MTANRCRASVACSLIGALVIGTLATADVAGLRVNATPSMPRGLWRVVDRDAPLHRGEIVTVCPPDITPVRQGAERGYIPAGNCPGGYQALVKPVVAIAGDLVSVTPGGVSVNDEPVQGTAQLAQDSAGRPLRAVPTGAYRVAQGDIWLLSGHDARSFDSRYFGAVPAANVQGIAQPVWVIR